MATGVVAAALREVVLPAYHRRAEQVSAVERLAEYHPRRGEVATKASRDGLRYERAAQRWLEAFGDYHRSPWLRFDDARGKGRMAQPDGLFIRETEIIIVEIKTQHCIEAYCQLRKLYYPVVRFCYPDHPIVLLEVCSDFSPTLRFPEPITVCDDLYEVAALGSGIAAMVWRRKDGRR